MTTSGNVQFQMVEERGWRRGLGNLLQGELSSWFKSSRWWKQLIVWLVIVNMFMVIFVYAASEEAKNPVEGPGMDLLMMYGIFGGMFVAIGAMIIVQGAFVGEKRSGTAAWVLSKPVTRSAFVVSRLVGNTIGVLVTSVLIPGVLVYVTLGAISDLGWLPPLDFLAGLGAIALSTLFWLTLTLMAGTFFESTGGVIGVPMVVFFLCRVVLARYPDLLDTGLPRGTVRRARKRVPGGVDVAHEWPGPIFVATGHLDGDLLRRVYRRGHLAFQSPGVLADRRTQIPLF